MSLLTSILLNPMVEPYFGWAARNQKHRDDGLFQNSPEFKSATSSCSSATISLSAPDIGPSGSAMAAEYSQTSIGGQSKAPTLQWSAPPSSSSVVEYALVNEDPDVPMPAPVTHGVYFGIPATKTSFSAPDLVEDSTKASHHLSGGFFYGQNTRDTIYVPPRPIKNHGPHRYVWTVVALNQKLDVDRIMAETDGKGPDKNVLLKEIQGKVVGWGQWVGTYENKW